MLADDIRLLATSHPDYKYVFYSPEDEQIEYFATDYFQIQLTLSISNTLYLELLSISNNFLGPFPLIPA